MNMNFFMPVNIITGKGCISKNTAMFSQHGKRCIIVTGKTAAKCSGALEDVIAALLKENIAYTIFDGIEQNPTYNSCKTASDMAKDFGAEFVVGIGGGSPLDASKAIAVLSVCSNPSVQTLYSMNWDKKPLPIIAVGTTAGTGSEVTPVSVITTPQGQKKSFRAYSVCPAVAFGDATYTMSLSPEFTRSTALDALSHCLESYFNRTTNDLAKTFALRGVEILLQMLKKTAQCSVTPLSFEDREKLYCASLYGGFAISITGTAFPHALGYFLSEQYNICHGNACAVYLEEFINYNLSVAPAEAHEFFKSLNTSKEELLKLIKQNLPNINVTLTNEKIDELAPRFENNNSLNKCYGTADCNFAVSVLKKLFM